MTDEPKGRSKGGIARAAKLTAAERSRIGKQAAAARWGTKTPSILHAGNFQAELGIDVACFVLDDPLKTAVISQTGMARALGLSPRGNAFIRFISSNAMADFIGGDLRNKVENPLKFQSVDRSTGKPPVAINGYQAEVLIDVCQAIIAASTEKSLIPRARYEKIIGQAHIIQGASAKLGIRDLVYALSGYSPSIEEVVTAFKIYVQEEAKKYEPEFPSELYIQWHRLYEIPVPVRGKPWHFKHLTVNHIYHPLAKSKGNLLKLLRALKAGEGDRQKKLFQFLNEIGTRALRMHLGRVLEMAESSSSREEYESKINTRFGSQYELNLN